MLTLKQKLFILAAVPVGLTGGGAVSLSQNPYIEVSQSFVVQNKRHAAEKVYDYEGYYTLQTANEASRTLALWVTSPGGVRTVFETAGVENEFTTLRSYERAFSLKRSESTPFFEVRFKAKTKADAVRLSATLETLLTSRLAEFQSSDSLTLDASPAVILERPVQLVRNLAYGSLLALAIAAFCILFRKALEAESHAS